jgi:replicative DNA helicase
MFKALDELMDKFKHDISLEDYSLWVQVNLGNDYITFLNLLKEERINEDIIETVLSELKTRDVAYSIAQKALSISEGKSAVNELQPLLDQLNQSTANKEETSQFVTTSLGELYDEAYKHPGLRWRLASLNSSLGSLRKGDFGFIFARPESGKTTFLASEISYFAEQVSQPII